MKKIVLICLVVFSTLVACGQSSTPNIGLQIPATGSNNWYIPLNYNFTKLDLLLSGNSPLPNLTVTGAGSFGGIVTAAGFAGPGGSGTALTTGAAQYSPAYFSAPGTAFVINGVTPFNGAAYYSTSAAPRAYLSSDLSTLLKAGATGCNTTGYTYSPFSNTCVPSSGGGTPGGSNGQPQINASGSFAGLGQVFDAQVGDTISSIETACASNPPCLYNVTVPQTITLSADHTLSANVFVNFGPGGSWTINGAHTFTFANSPLSQYLSVHLAGTSTLRGGSGSIPVEWFGVKGFVTKAAARAGSDYGIQDQKCLDFLIGNGGWCQLQALAYNFTTGPVIITNSIGIHGMLPRDSFNGAIVSTIISNATSGKMIDVHGTSQSVFIVSNSFKDFGIERQVQCTSMTPTDCIGISLNHAVGTIIENVTSNDNLDHLYYHDAASIGTGHHFSFLCNNGLFPSLVDSYTAGQSINCEDGDSDDGEPSGTVITNNVTLYTQGTASNSNSVISTTFNIHGSHINDQNMTFPGAAGDTTNGIKLTYSGSGAADSCADIQIVQPSIEAAVAGIKISGLAPIGCQPSVIISGGGYILANSAGAKLIDCENSIGVMVSGGIELISASGASSTVGVYENGCSGVHIGPIKVIALTNAVLLSSSTDTTIGGVNATNVATCVSFTSTSIHNSVQNSSCNGTFSLGFITDGTSTANDQSGNTCSTLTGCIGGSGFVGFAPSSLAAGSTIGGAPISSGNCMIPMKVTVGSPTTTITFASIPQTCTNLKLTITGENSAPAGDFAAVIFNGDTAAHYNFVFIDANISTSPVWSSSTGAASATPSTFYLAGAVTNGWSQGSGFIANYTGTTFRKGISITGLSDDNPASSNAFTYQSLESWNATPAAITQIDLIAGGGFNFVAGTVATLTGE